MDGLFSSISIKTQKKETAPQFPEDYADIMPCTAEQGIDFISKYSGQVVAIQLTIAFHVADDWFNSTSSFQLLFHLGRHTSLPTENNNPLQNPAIRREIAVLQESVNHQKRWGRLKNDKYPTHGFGNMLIPVIHENRDDKSSWQLLQYTYRNMFFFPHFLIG